ncbi:hypothetical protein JTB14_034700 [Gonioctena quinquepunctata]|nr:hypothetical protein JTB14_034700 [Gonioctena quinquepunctata]
MEVRESQTLKKKESLLKASEKKEGWEVGYFRGKISVGVHDKCRKTYTNKRTILAHIKRREKFMETHKPRETRSAVPDFICGLPITKQFLAAEAKKPPDLRNVVTQLRDITGEKYKDDILFTFQKNKKTVVCFKNIGGKILNDAFYQQKCKSEKEERHRIVEAAAKIICDDIRSQDYDVKEYPTVSWMVHNRKKGRCKEKWKNKSHAISHCIISAVRPRSLLSNLQVGLAAFICKNTYVEAVRFEISSTLKTESELCAEGFIQFIYDNADFNTQTIYGCNTFHVMGGMYTVGPASAVPPDATIARLTKIPSAAEVVGRFGHLTLKHFEAKQGGDGLKEIKIQDLSSKFQTSPSTYPSAAEVLWLYSKNKEFDITPGWSAFMEKATKDLPFEETYTACLPFINSPPSDCDTIHTAMLESIEKCRAKGQTWCFITFDQPLYLKARFFAANSNDPRLKYVVLRLGGFHLLMSYLGSVCYPMER